MYLPLSELYGMTMRDFQYYIYGYAERQRSKMHSLAQLAIMIGITTRSKRPIYKVNQLMSDSHSTHYQHSMQEPAGKPITDEAIIPIREIQKLMKSDPKKAREQLSEWKGKFQRNFEAVRKSPTYTKSTISSDDIEWQ